MSGINFTQEQLDAVNDLLAEKVAFTSQEFQETGVDIRNMHAAISALGYGDDDGSLNVYVTGAGECSFVMSIVPVEVECGGVTAGQSTSINSDDDWQEFVKENDLDDEVSNLVAEIRQGVVEMDIAMINLDDELTQDQKDAIIDATIEKNQDLMGIAQMSPDERAAEMEDLRQQLDTMSSGQFSEFMNGQNGKSYATDANDWGSYHHDMTLADPEGYGALADRYKDLQYAEDGRGDVQRFIKQLEEVRPEILEMVRLPADDSVQAAPNALNM